MSIERLAKTTFLVTSASGWEQRAKVEVSAPLTGAKGRAMFMRGNILLTCEDPPDAALSILGDVETEYVGRIIPLQAKCDIGKGPEHLDTLAAASDLLPGPDPEATFKAKCERRGDHQWASQEAEIAVGIRTAERTGAPVDFDAPQQIVAVQVFQDTAFLGVAWADEMLRKEITRMRKYAPGQRPLNRAELKLREVIERFKLDLAPDARALDVGAAPGGWSKVLAESVAEVVAVDPGELDERVLALPNVTHMRVRAETLLTAPDIGKFDIITDDMNMDPDASAQVLVDLAPLVKPGATGIMTVKFVTRRRRELTRAALDVLEQSYEDPRIGRVPHNAKETTVVVRRAD